MYQNFAAQAPEDYAFETRSMRLNGHCTSVRLEAAFWRVIADIADRDGLSVAQFVSQLHAEVMVAHGEARNFTSLLRCACLAHLQRSQPTMVAAE